MCIMHCMRYLDTRFQRRRGFFTGVYGKMLMDTLTIHEYELFTHRPLEHVCQQGPSPTGQSQSVVKRPF